MKAGSKLPVWGVIGGMGPLASAEFLKNIYRFSLGTPEQQMPRVILLSDPDVPDRTEAIKNGQHREILDRLEELLCQLLAMKVDRLVMACITAHCFLPELPKPLLSRIPLVSLLDVICDSLRNDDQKYMLLCTSGTRQYRLFQSHPQWSVIEPRISFPNASHQKQIHDFLYDVKTTCDFAGLSLLQAIRKSYDIDGFVCGCTEAHLFVRDLIDNNIPVIDPLLILAQRIAGYVPGNMKEHGEHLQKSNPNAWSYPPDSTSNLQVPEK